MFNIVIKFFTVFSIKVALGLSMVGICEIALAKEKISESVVKQVAEPVKGLEKNLVKKNRQTTFNKSPSLLPVFNYPLFGRLPVLSGGRVKPLAVFAREYLTAFSGKGTLREGGSALSWLAEVLFNPSLSFERNIFKISNPEVVDSLGLEKRKKSLYSFNELSQALDKIIENLNTIKNKPEKNRALIETQLLNLYGTVMAYSQLSRSFSLILPLFSVSTPFAVKKTGLIAEKQYSYLEVLKFQKKWEAEVTKITQKKKINQLSKGEMELLLFTFKMDRVARDEENNLFRIIPPQWSENKTLWLSPWDLVRTGGGSPATAQYMESFSHLIKVYQKESDTTTISSSVEKVYQQSLQLSKGIISSKILFMEKLLDDIKFFNKSLLFYILALVLLFFGGWLRLKKQELLFNIAFISLIIGFLFHLMGVVFRIVIMARPPVATLYESFIFVALVTVGFGLFLKQVKKDNIGLLVGSLAGGFLHIVALKYKGPESLELLVPVLNTNFWLAVHVLCITTGYACALVTSLIAHAYIFLKCFSKKVTKQAFTKLHKSITGMSFLALFFCLFGTILGGIWADQSWGRFWGWDPKENGALFIVLWFLVLFHGKMAGLLKEKGFALGHILTNITVALSWLGVNLLSVGLHSYGFVSSTAYGLAIFCFLELSFFFFALIKLRRLKVKTQ